MSDPRISSPWAHGLMLAAIVVGVLTAASSWEWNHGLMLTLAGAGMLGFKPVARLPMGWWWLAGGFVLSTGLVFLPVGEMPAWRQGLEALGLETGGLRAVQPQLAAEMGALWALALAVGLWAAGQRTSEDGLKGWAMGFALAVAAYALISIGKSSLAETASGRPGVFGFFPNRNHTATLLAMGSVAGIASLAQAIRDKRGWGIGLGIFATLVCLWATLVASESRAGLVLVAVGGVGWWLMLGRGYLGRHAWTAVVLLGLAVAGGFLVGNSKIRQRIDATKEKLESLESTPGVPGDDRVAGSVESRDVLAELDFRVPVWRDTLGMIADAPVSGVGGGHYWGVFPQFRNHTLSNAHSDGAHPESDWLWIAAEAGVPAAVFLLVLVVSAGVYGMIGARRHRVRALRVGCVIAALLVAIHGIFDVPGHRIPLAWAAAFLFSLALPAEERGERSRPRVWPCRLIGGLVMFAGLALLWSWWAGVQTPATVLAERTRGELRRLYQLDQAKQQEALERGEEYTPPAGEDLLEQAMAEADEALEILPLDRGLWHWKGYLALHYDDKSAAAERAFSLERELDPDWVGAPLRQARAWVPIDAEKVEGLWQEALLRAKRLDSRGNQGNWAKRARSEMSQMARGREELEARFGSFEGEK